MSLDKIRIARRSWLMPMITRADKYLSGWKATLLNTMGRVVLADSILGNLLIYAMGALELPKGAIDLLDVRRRAFLCTSEDKANGAQCLIAWEQVRTPRNLGGLRLKNLHLQNQCMLLKLLHRLFNPTYRAITTVRPRDSASTSFWDDVWLADAPLAECYHALHSHATPDASVQLVLRDGIDNILQPRLTRIAVGNTPSSSRSSGVSP